MKTRLLLTPEQEADLREIRAAALSGVSAATIFGELRREPMEQGARSYIDLVTIPAHVADALRATYKAAMSAPPKRRKVSRGAKQAIAAPP